MKKLFFAAVVAVVAVGGALTANATSLFIQGTNEEVICEGVGATCASYINGRTVYLVPNPGPQDQPVPLSEYEDLLKTN